MACPPSNPVEALQTPRRSTSSRFLLPTSPGVWNGLSNFKPGRSTSSPISSSRPLEWLVHRSSSRGLETLSKHFQPDFFFPGVWNGLSTFTLTARFLLPGRLEWLVHFPTPPKHFQPEFRMPCMSTFKPRRSTSSLTSFSWRFGIACRPCQPPPNHVQPASLAGSWE